MKDKKDPIVPNPAESPQFSPRLVSTWTTWLLNLIKNITIEPALFLISFSTQMDDVSLQQMTIYKTCMLDFEDQPFGGNETICSQLELEEYREENGIVQEEFNNFKVYQALVSSVFPVFFSFYMGAWCDLFGRKLLFYCYLTARVLEEVVVIICAIFLLSPKEYILLAGLPLAFVGGFGVFYLALNAFLADITEPDKLAFRFGMLHLASSLGRSTGPIVGATIYEHFGYIGVFSASLLGTALGSLYLVVRIWTFKWTPPKSKADRHAFSPMHIVDCITTTIKYRPGPNRRYIFMFMAMICLSIISYIGEYSMDFVFVRTVFNWGVSQYSTYSFVTSFAAIVGQAIFIPLISLMGISESFVLMCLYLSFVARYVIKAFATDPWMYYLGGLVDILSSYCFSIIKAMSTLCVAPNELGKINAVLSALENLLPVVAVKAYAGVWGATYEKYPGAIYLCSAEISLLAFSIAVYVHFSLRGRKISEVTKEGADRLSPQERAEKERIQDRKLSPETFDWSSL